MFCCQIRSDKDLEAKVEYFLTGPGANKPPIDLFTVDRHTGFVRIHDIVDHEKYPFFNVSLNQYVLNRLLWGRGQIYFSGQTLWKKSNSVGENSRKGVMN